MASVRPGDRDGEQLALLTPGGRSSARTAARSRPRRPERVAAAHQPVARVAVDVPLPHLDRLFDYLVDEQLAEAAQPGVRVRVRFSGRAVDAYVVERADSTEHVGRLAFLDKVVSPEPVLAPEILRLSREVADCYAGTLADVLRLAVPPRHARVEAEPVRAPEASPHLDDAPGTWDRYQNGSALHAAVRDGRAVRAVWTALPGPGWPDELARLVAAALAGSRGALVVVPDHRDVSRLDAVLSERLGADRHVVLTAELGPAERYRRWLRIRRGEVRAVLGTRAAMFAPVQRLGLAVVWDDGDDLHAEPRAPYPHVRTVLALRSTLETASLLVGGLSRSAEGSALVSSGAARSVAASRQLVRRAAPAVVADDGAEHPADAGVRGARLPTVAWRVAHESLRSGPVLVQVPRAGYRPGLACAQCRAPARCAACQGPLGSANADAPPACRWCGRVAADWRCPVCESRRMRATAVGSRRTAEELGRAFPRTDVRRSGSGGEVLAQVGPEPAVVVATPGAEPVAERGYAAALLLDGWALLGRPDLRAAEEALRRWTTAAALVRPAAEGGRVVLVAPPGAPAVQALVRWDQAGFADRELTERTELGFPPATSMASLTGSAAAIGELVAAAKLPPRTDVLGPVPVPAASDGAEQERLLVRVPRADARRLAAALHAGAAVRSAHKDAGAVRVQVDPTEIG